MKITLTDESQTVIETLGSEKIYGQVPEMLICGQNCEHLHRLGKNGEQTYCSLHNNRYDFPNKSKQETPYGQLPFRHIDCLRIDPSLHEYDRLWVIMSAQIHRIAKPVPSG